MIIKNWMDIFGDGIVIHQSLAPPTYSATQYLRYEDAVFTILRKGLPITITIAGEWL